MEVGGLGGGRGGGGGGGDGCFGEHVCFSSPVLTVDVHVDAVFVCECACFCLPCVCACCVCVCMHAVCVCCGPSYSSSMPDGARCD